MPSNRHRTVTALKTAARRIIQQQPRNMTELANITCSISSEYLVPINLDHISLNANGVSLDDIDVDADTRDACQEILWDCNLAEHPDNRQPKASQAALDRLETITYQALKLATMADNMLEAIYNHRDNYPGIIPRNIADQGKDTLAECALLHETLEDTLDENL
ncbi:hypothetical protein ACJ79_gp22 [Propionibacterium phage PHL199M00]|uniref:Uncharacterized protein n=1 Tax=Propionibacterium phage PHL199M00 TaxID=1500830 RepID=A0A0E3DNH3_9CAUD|nr:hypothetical protein ACJ79_gp22 [Propionibacterium phage PHL199M00]AII30053.1 hypothetical protein PHL199M00_22 [Propionibacterium phage PHL199M00]